VSRAVTNDDSVYVAGGTVTVTGAALPIENVKALLRAEMGSCIAGILASKISTPHTPTVRPIGIEYSFDSGYTLVSRVDESMVRMVSVSENGGVVIYGTM
jgi:hypothetical protein